MVTSLMGLLCDLELFAECQAKGESGNSDFPQTFMNSTIVLFLNLHHEDHSCFLVMSW